MAKYMLNICYGDQVSRERSTHPEDNDFVMQKYREWSDKMGPRIESAHKLKDGEGRRLSFQNGRIQDGPYVETKECIGGYYIIEAANYAEAMKMAEDCPTLRYQGGYVEVREVEF